MKLHQMYKPIVLLVWMLAFSLIVMGSERGSNGEVKGSVEAVRGSVVAVEEIESLSQDAVRGSSSDWVRAVRGSHDNALMSCRLDITPFFLWKPFIVAGPLVDESSPFASKVAVSVVFSVFSW